MKHRMILLAVFTMIFFSLNALEFQEDWETGDFASNGWSFEEEQGNWELDDEMGNPGTSAYFSGVPLTSGYNHILVSPMLDGTQSTTLFMDYDFIGNVTRPGAEHLSVVLKPEGEDWVEIADYFYDTPGAPSEWLHESYNISTIAGGYNFQVGFQAHGVYSMNLNGWNVDNIEIYESAPAELPFVESWTSESFATNNWGFDPNQGNWDIVPYNGDPLAEFLYMDIFNYSFALTSQTFNPDGFDSIEVSYDVALYNYDTTGTEYLAVEILSDGNWQEVTSYCNNIDDFSTSESYDITNFVNGSLFNIRFRVYGDDAFNIDAWTIDNIVISDGSPMDAPHVYGHVVNAETNEPIIDAVVYLDDIAQVTLNDGGLNSGDMGFDFEDLSTGAVNLSCTAPGFDIYSESLYLSNGDELQIDIMLNPVVQNQAPQNLHANQTGYNDFEMQWNPVEIDQYLEEIFDDGVAESFSAVQEYNDQIIANRFQYMEEIELQKAQYYIQLGESIPADAAEIEFYITGDTNGQPDLNNMLINPVILDDIDAANSLVFWLEIPVDLIIPENTPFYVCVKWNQENYNAEVLSLGIDSTLPQGNSYISSDGGSIWNQEINGSSFNAMIRTQYLPQEETDQILLGYNLYSNGQMVNSELISQTSYMQSDLEPGEYSYQVSAVYNDIESELSEPITIEAGILPAPYYVGATFISAGQPRVNLFWQTIPYPDVELTGFNLYRNSEIINEEMLPDSITVFVDTLLTNGMEYSYQVVAVYDCGESDPSDSTCVDVLFAPNNLYTIPWQDHIEIGWENVSDPEDPVELIGYNVYNSGVILNNDPITETTYLDYDYQNQNEYWVKSVYNTGESMIAEICFVNGGTQVINPPESLDADIEEQDVHLSWESPDEGNWINWDEGDCGESFGMEDQADFTAVIEFDEVELLDYESRKIRKIAFYPVEEAEYTVIVWKNSEYNTEEYTIFQEIPVSEVQLERWNVVPVNNVEIIDAVTKVRIGIRCSNYTESPLACDGGPNACCMADYVLVNDEWTNLSVDYGIDANWKIRMYIAEDYFPGQYCDTRYDLCGYNIYRDSELISEISCVNDFYVDEGLQYGEYSYEISALYNISGLFVYESDLSDALELMVLEPYYPAPENFEVQITDYNTTLLSWEIEALPGVIEINDSTLHKKGIDETTVIRNRELTGFNIYRNSTILVTLPGDEMCWSDSLLPEGNYCYQVAATYDPHISQLSPECEIDVILPAPVELYGDVADQDVILSWDMTHPEWDLQHFNVYRNSEVIAESVSDIIYIDENLPDGDYIYEIQAVFFGNYQSELSEPFELSMVTSPDNLIPVITELQGNYPNPFNPETTIEFAIAEPEDVELVVYNLKGEKVRTLISEELAAGYYQIVWDGRNTQGDISSSGIYFYRLQAGKYTSIKKMSLLK